MRDVCYVSVDKTYDLVISSDNAANIGEKEGDQIRAPYSLVAESLFRVAFMENRAVGAQPLTVVLYNFSDEYVWEEWVQTIKKQLNSLGFDVPITGSTESNFPLSQSAFGLSIIGRVEKRKIKDRKTPEGARFAVIGEPLVGEEVIAHQERMVPLSTFEQVVHHNGVYEVLPVGSKGIEKEIRMLLQINGLSTSIQSNCDIDLHKPAGPSTCFIITYEEGKEADIRTLTGDLFHSLTTL
ncbi:ATPase [Halobacillus litoralis]|uniref:ATPase n=1 Tax=Halobacillus litoralis TaxID=45668 RepID=A0A410MC63_9BACI|nr:ATPase [Halobacillus litoralis]QAS52297.1 ATPase [Halobacillus litoralis]